MGTGRHPRWSDWELELTDHVLDRMAERGCAETDLRLMLAEPRVFTRDPQAGRWRIAARIGRRRWIVIVEPDIVRRRLIVITLFAVDWSGHG